MGWRGKADINIFSFAVINELQTQKVREIMDSNTFKYILDIGETVAVEFKRCGNGISPDTYETVCSFLNRFGGDLYLGVEDNGIVAGLPPKAITDMANNFVTMVSNPEIISPTVYLAPKIFKYKGKQILHIHVPPSSEVHSCKRVIYDRIGDADVKVTATGQVAQMYIRKQRIFTEKKVYPYITLDDLRLDMLPRIKQMAMNRYQNHPWKDLSDFELLKSASLYGEDYETGKMGFNLASVMLLGRDNVIKNIAPAYRTDSILRKVNVDRYDDRIIVETNLIESYDQLMQFAEKHLWDKFYLEDDTRISLRNAIAREMLANTLIHREFTSSFYAQFIIEKDKMTVSNANRAESSGHITPDNFTPNPKNPIIAAFFRNIGLADELGSGVRNLFKYVVRYSGKEPELIDGDIFKIIVPLDDSYSFDLNTANGETDSEEIKAQSKRNQSAIKAQSKRKIDGLESLENAVLDYFRDNPRATQLEVAAAINKSRRSVQDTIALLKNKVRLRREGARSNGKWVVE